MKKSTPFSQTYDGKQVAAERRQELRWAKQAEACKIKYGPKGNLKPLETEPSAPIMTPKPRRSVSEMFAALEAQTEAALGQS